MSHYDVPYDLAVLIPTDGGGDVLHLRTRRHGSTMCALPTLAGDRPPDPTVRARYTSQYGTLCRTCFDRLADLDDVELDAWRQSRWKPNG